MLIYLTLAFTIGVLNGLCFWLGYRAARPQGIVITAPSLEDAMKILQEMRP